MTLLPYQVNFIRNLRTIRLVLLESCPPDETTEHIKAINDAVDTLESGNELNDFQYSRTLDAMGYLVYQDYLWEGEKDDNKETDTK